MIRYIMFEVKVHGLSFITTAEVHEFMEQVYQQIKVIHPNLNFTNDVEIKLVEQSGTDKK